jgi:hypothetical protein
LNVLYSYAVGCGTDNGHCGFGLKPQARTSESQGAAASTLNDPEGVINEFPNFLSRRRHVLVEPLAHVPERGFWRSSIHAP